MLLHSSLLIIFCLAGVVRPLMGQAFAAPVTRRLSVAILDFGPSDTGRRAAEHLALLLSTEQNPAAEVKISVIDRDQSRAAAHGVGYTNSLNLSLREARDLGAALGADFYIAGEAQTARRVPASAPAYFESYAVIFIISTRTGRLIGWDRPSQVASTPGQAESALMNELNARTRTRYASSMLAAHEQEARERRAQVSALAGEIEVIEDLSGDNEDSLTRKDWRLPLPFRRLRPPYPETAARAEVEATVDVLVDINEDGEVSRTEIVRWAGFGLDEAVTSTVRQMHFRAALRQGVPVPVRIMLRYNFRRLSNHQPAQ